MKKFFQDVGRSFPAGIRQSRSFATKQSGSVETGQGLTEGQTAINEIKELYETGQYKIAWLKIKKIEGNYPGCSKATAYYRGKVGIKLVEEDSELKSKLNI